MFDYFFSLFSNDIGIDLGTDSIKVVALEVVAEWPNAHAWKGLFFQEEKPWKKKGFVERWSWQSKPRRGRRTKAREFGKLGP